MKSLPLSLQDKALLNARNMAETIIGHIKEFSSLNLSKHRSVINAFVHIIAAITAYQINPFKPKLNLQPRYQYLFADGACRVSVDRDATLRGMRADVRESGGLCLRPSLTAIGPAAYGHRLQPRQDVSSLVGCFQ